MKVTVGQARELAVSLLTEVGLRSDRAETTARALTLAQAWGLPSHGLMRLPSYLNRTVAGGHPVDAELTPVTDTGALVVLNGNGGLGQWQVAEAVGVGMTRATEHGVALVAVADSGHCGALGTFAADAAEAGFASLIFSTGPAVMPPWGGSEKFLSTSPLAAAFPGSPRPLVVDLAMSTVARGTIAHYAAQDQPLPEGWALDASGQPTTDPHRALTGLLSPLGGAKGYALAFMVEALTAGLVGPSPAQQVTDLFRPQDNARRQGIAHLSIIIDPSRTDGTGDPEATAIRLTQLASSARDAGGRPPGARRLAPAEVTDTTPIEVDDQLWTTLHDRLRGQS